ncbi:hypothetical protein predicted by Glimmer/Critica [Sorangium cellulosum So ce56]|uniref:Ferritin-like domain-containing protein n=1 Tax=Sorangium cellulosum (strain So ce56) TaxID=448385 RepID=A9G7S2_SORC5|nr:ferritin-like domain-containing protein [Sorangium cellulosum]CAN95898.1 hypothetical protein predicted by Glimmer/Critica [Sorangium cellulosum So ce56]
MTLSRRSPSDADLWRRLVWWSQASDRMVGGCAGGCALAVVVSAILLALGARALHVLAVAAALGSALEGARRACEAGRTRALDAAATRLLESRGLSREEVERAAATLRSGRIEELDASLAFESDPFHRAIESVVGGADASAPPICDPTDGARAVVVGLGQRWAAVLRFTHDDLREACVHERLFTWNGGAGPRRLDLPIDADERALLERSIEALAKSPTSTDPAASPRMLDDRTLAIGIAVVDRTGHRRGATGEVDLTPGVRAPVNGDGGGPYRAAAHHAEQVCSEVAVIELEGHRHTLSRSPRDAGAASVLAHVVVHAAARVVHPLVLLKLPPEVRKGRPLRVDGAPLIANARPSSDWIDAVATIPEADPGRRGALSDRWLRAALAEHSSIVAFERLAGVLSGLGAPEALVDRARSAMDDERRHARDAFSLAAAYSGEMVGPGPLPVPDAPPPSVDALAIETFFDGCVGETLAARQASAALAGCRVPAACEALERVAIDERRHAELAWDMLAWLWPRTSVRARAAIAEAPLPPPALRGAGERDRRNGEWLAWHGWLTTAEEMEIEIAAWSEEIGPRRDALPAFARRSKASTVSAA